MFCFIYDTGRGRTNESASLVKPNITPEIRGSVIQPPFIVHGRHSATLILLGLLYVWRWRHRDPPNNGYC